MTKLLTALTVVTILAAMAAGTVEPKVSPTAGAVPAPPTFTISIEELQRQVDARTLPVLEIENFY